MRWLCVTAQDTAGGLGQDSGGGSHDWTYDWTHVERRWSVAYGYGYARLDPQKYPCTTYKVVPYLVRSRLFNNCTSSPKLR